MTPWRRNDRSRFLYQRCVCVRCRTFRINGLSGANLDLSFVLLKRNNNVATLNNIAANYLDDHSALLLISGSMPILSFHETLDNKNPYGTDVEYTVLLFRACTTAWFSIIYLRVSSSPLYINTIRVYSFYRCCIVLFNETYPKRADFSGVAAVGILFLSLEQNGGE